ncbi:putative histone-lysine N-methyltransferase chromatin regulator PHD family [Helianthus annuus]|uniref:Histone-lysine N-methyltransferase chromatin regulator PHD family n=3 Tax=Helianthus annuus TaxID=4232 RepID=A0A9K3E401_HELAN|nr:PHD finger protein EHD3 isoform X1 [Helianthus annuus]KAF5765887.1 putative histone-lysine N-methyltransferase chromatin regulator PHD family [Helianthus annuus]KAJ0452357.1 putative [histone H3]-lysine(4) N-trimethyltransferase chromatin regulator PHD family [Helianthus annuus]KAJ0474252.1 putative [histone H3]-lysine(4) N-trimethyltransferase chromatin regulator PHD family [Helianthus annuus]KAJ0649822.1 putative [histone H3]-lysine(4) N-trimethyltransferase chromatin regulator PHD family 
MIQENEATKDNCNGGVSFREGSSSEGLRFYKRRKRIKMSDSDDKMKAADGSVPNQDNHLLSFDASTYEPGECSLRPCSNGHENSLAGCSQNTCMTHKESGFTPVIKKSLDNVERSDNQTNSSAPEPSRDMSCGLSKQSEGSTHSELCFGALSDILNSDKFSQVCGLLLKNFGVVNVNQVLNIDAISSKMKNGAYETSPVLCVKDIQQVWTKLQQVGNEMVTLANNLSDISRAHYDQCFRKPHATEAGGCQRCGEKAEVKNCLVCDSCEDVYHLSCTELVGTEIPLNWYCASCVSNGAGSPHDNCVVCEKLKASASVPLVNGVSTNEQSQDVPNLHDVTDENQSSNICFMCKSEVKIGDDYKRCGHSLCGHKFYHAKCLTSKQLVVCGPCWYCPSCLCRRCLVDKDDDQIVLCDGCDEAYHIYCTLPQLLSIPKGSWFCRKCDRKVKGINTMKRVYESMQKKVKIEDGLEKAEREATDEREGIDMLVTAAKTLGSSDAFWNTRSNIL